MRLPAASPARIKNLIHGFQAFVIFLGWALTIAVLTRGGGVDGRSGWYFGLCWLTIPALVYLVAVPLFPRARRFGNVYAFATVDGLFVILWFSAWVAVASYVAEGKSKGEDAQPSDKPKKTGCDAFAYGDATKCELATGTVILGVVIFLAFIATSFFSFRNVIQFRRTGTLPDAVTDPTFDAQTQAAFSSNPAQDFDEENDFRSGRAGDVPAQFPHDRDEDYALLQQSEADDLGAPHHAMQGAYDPTAPNPGSVMHDYDTSYGGAYGQHYSEPSGTYGDSDYHPAGGYGR